jgi:hypothetical protein
MSGVRYDEPRFQVSGDRVLLVALGDGIDLRVNEAVRALTERLRRDPPRGHGGGAARLQIPGRGV